MMDNCSADEPTLRFELNRYLAGRARRRPTRWVSGSGWRLGRTPVGVAAPT